MSQPAVEKKKAPYKVAILVAWSVILTALTLIMGAVPMLGARRSMGRLAFWFVYLTIGLVTALSGWIVLGVSLTALTVLVGLFTEFELRGDNLIEAGTKSTALSFGLLASSFYLWVYRQGAGWYENLIQAGEKALDQLALFKVGSEVPFKVEDLVAQAPSAAVILLLVSLMLALIFERRVLTWLEVPTLPKRVPLNRFRVPDHVIWFFILGLLGSFLKVEVKWLEVLSVNVLNVTILLYFFQGLSVLTSYFEFFRVGFFWRAFWLVVLVSQLFLLMSLLGLLDYWGDFRARFIKKKAAEVKKG